MYAFVCEAEEAESDSNLADGRSLVCRTDGECTHGADADAALVAVI